MESSSEKKLEATILAVGTEVTSGQISNGNAAMISGLLEDFGIETVLHEAVPDRWDLILKGLERSVLSSNLVFVTGGLGPTSDDFTRNVVAEFFEKPLEHNEASEERIKERMKTLGRPYLKSQSQQCFFPKESLILINNAGTADAFYFLWKEKHIWILPGPPAEVSAIWNDHIATQIKELAPERHNLKRFRWNCIGKPEAELAELVEAAVKGSDLITGYRLHPPYVEVKVWMDENKIQAPLIEKVEDVIRRWLIVKDDEDLAEMFLEKLPENTQVMIYDGATDGYFTERMNTKLRHEKWQAFRDRVEVISLWPALPSSPSSKTLNIPAATDQLRWTKETLEKWQGLNPQHFVIVLSPLLATGEWIVGLSFDKETRLEPLRSPFLQTLNHPRSRLAAVELSIEAALEFLEEL